MVRSGHAPERRSFLGVRHGEPGTTRAPRRPGTEYHSASASDSSDALPPTAVVFTDVVRSLTKRSRVRPAGLGTGAGQPVPPNGCTPTTAPIWLRLM